MNYFLKHNSFLILFVLLGSCVGKYWDRKKHQFHRRPTEKVEMNSRAMQESCQKIKLDMSCDDYFVAIWDGYGKQVFYSVIDGLNVDICYDPTQCYLLYIYSDGCNYEIILDGKVARTGKMKEYDEVYVFVGACEDSCPGKQQIYFLTYLDGSGDVNYTFHRSGHGVIEGTILEGNAIGYCIETDSCNLIDCAEEGTSYAHFNVDGSLYDSGFGTSKIFGNCEKNCSDTTILISTNQEHGNLTLLIESDDARDTSEVLSDGQAKAICIDKSKCSVISGHGRAYYFFLRNGSVHDGSWVSDYYRYFGPCETNCSKKPNLADTERGLQIISRLSTISGMDQLADFTSDRYKAACWLIHDDVQQISEDDPKLIQRYVLSVIYFTTGGEKDWFAPLGFLTASDECDWSAVTCTNQFVTTLTIESNNMVGTLASELYSLFQLEHLSLVRNELHGSIPVGISRLLFLKHINFSYNRFIGTIPEELFLISGLESVYMNINMITGTIPNMHTDMLLLSSILLGGNLLSGTIPEWIGNAAALESFQIQLNSLSGSIPSELFAMSSLVYLDLASNQFSGSIQLPKGIKNISLTSAWLEYNKLIGSIPSDIDKLKKLERFSLHDNLLSGTVPRTIGALKNLYQLLIENNNIKGTIPFTNCEDFDILSADCSEPKNIICPCCTRCFGLFTSKDVLPCPSSTLQVKPLEGTKDFSFLVEKEDGQLVIDYYWNGRDDLVQACISPTECMKIGPYYETILTLSIDDNVLFDKVDDSEWRLFGYSGNGTMKPNVCDEYAICNLALRPGTPQRNLFNQITRFSGVDIFQDQSKQYESLCWSLNDLDSKAESAQQNILNVQRYILVLLYLNNGGDGWTNNEKWMTSVHECEWYGVSCHAHGGLVDKLDLSNNNLVGSLPPELGELRGLEHLILSRNNLKGSMPIELVNLKNLITLDLSNNRLVGTIHTEIHYLKNLEILDISTNQFSSALPSEICLIRTLTSFNAAQNTLSGKIPPEFRNMTLIKFISVGKNLMYGDLKMIDGLMNLEHIDFSNNYFTGSLPLFKGQRKLKVARLNNNAFSGGITTDVGEMVSLDELLIFSNRITGSLPSQIGQLKNISSLSVAYNYLKGTVPTEVSSMRNLSMMHLHVNKLTGNLNYFDYKINSFIADCGKSEAFKANLDCPGCTECCNGDGDCVTVLQTWPGEKLKSIQFSSGLFVVLLLAGVSCILSFTSVVIGMVGTRLPPLPYAVGPQFQQDSVYRWFLSSCKKAWFIASITVLFQVWIAFMFLRAGDSTYAANLWIYTINCPNTETFCTDEKLTNLYGWLTFVSITAVYLLKDIFTGLLLFYESSVHFNVRGIMTGMVLLNVTILSIVASSIFLYATSISNIAIIKDAVVVLFLNDIDEQVFKFFEFVTPGWTDTIEADVARNCLNDSRENMVTDISENIDVSYSEDIVLDISQDSDKEHGSCVNKVDDEKTANATTEMVEEENALGEIELVERLKMVEYENSILKDEHSILKDENLILKERLRKVEVDLKYLMERLNVTRN